MYLKSSRLALLHDELHVHVLHVLYIHMLIFSIQCLFNCYKIYFCCYKGKESVISFFVVFLFFVLLIKDVLY